MTHSPRSDDRGRFRVRMYRHLTSGRVAGEADEGESVVPGNWHE